jgi:hypothetical protein
VIGRGGQRSAFTPHTKPPDPRNTSRHREDIALGSKIKRGRLCGPQCRMVGPGRLPRRRWAPTKCRYKNRLAASLGISPGKWPGMVVLSRKFRVFSRRGSNWQEPCLCRTCVQVPAPRALRYLWPFTGMRFLRQHESCASSYDSRGGRPCTSRAGQSFLRTMSRPLATGA